MTYDEWIAAYVARTPLLYGACRSACDEMRQAFPELVEVRGWCNNREHVWLKDPQGKVVDPTAGQFESAREVWGHSTDLVYVEFKPGDTVRVGRCLTCGDHIYAAVQSLTDPSYHRSACDDECERELLDEYRVIGSREDPL